MFKQIFFILLFSITFASNAFAFTDIQKDSLDYMQKHEIIHGYSDGTFRPNDHINRAEFLKLVFEASGIEIEDVQTKCFPDIEVDQWYSDYICTAKNKELIKGYDDGSFKPEQNINRAEALKIISNLTASTLFDAGEYSSDLNNINDVLKISAQNISQNQMYQDVSSSEWYALYIYYALANGYIDQNNYFYPNNLMNREDTAEIMFRNILNSKLAAHNYRNINGGIGCYELNNQLAECAEDFFKIEDRVSKLTLTDFNNFHSYDSYETNTVFKTNYSLSENDTTYRILDFDINPDDFETIYKPHSPYEAWPKIFVLAMFTNNDNTPYKYEWFPSDSHHIYALDNIENEVITLSFMGNCDVSGACLDNTYSNYAKYSSKTFQYLNNPLVTILDYYYSRGSLPPPYHYEYSININSDGNLFLEYFPDYANDITDGSLIYYYNLHLTADELNNFINSVKNEVTDLNQLEYSGEDMIGGSYQTIDVSIDGQKYSIDSEKSYISDDTEEKFDFITTQINSLIPDEIWKEINTKQQNYIDNYEELSE